MQEIGKLVLGIDLCDDITQVAVMRPHAAEPDAVCFDDRARKEFLSTQLYAAGDKGIHIGETPEPGEKVLSHFLHAAVRGEEVTAGESAYPASKLLECYVSLLLQKIREHFGGQEIGFVTVTCEDANTKESVRRLLSDIFRKQAGIGENCLVLSHLEAFLHFAIRQEEGLWKDGSAAFDYTADGLVFYSMECRSVGGRRLLLADYKDYSEVIPPDFVTTMEKERCALTFERLAEMALQQKVAALFVTGRAFEGEWVGDVLRLLSSGRRVFRGQNLYTQGACYAGTEEFRKERNADFSLLMPNQITTDVFLLAENTQQEEGVLLAKTGDIFQKVYGTAEVLLDSTDKLTIKVLRAGLGTPVILRVAPKNLELRGDRTNRYQVRLFFPKRDLMAIQLKETGFGEFYPATCRIYEEVVDLSQFDH